MSTSFLRWTAAALAGLAFAVAIGIAASTLASERIGLSSEPLTAGGELAPAAVRKRPAPAPVPQRPAPAPQPAPAAPGADDYGGGDSGQNQEEHEHEHESEPDGDGDD